MKRALAVFFLLMSITSIALADGGGLPPTSTTPVHPLAVR